MPLAFLRAMAAGVAQPAGNFLPQLMTTHNCPPGWNPKSYAHWLRGERQAAINIALAELSKPGARIPVAPFLQSAYYIYLCGDPRGAAHLLTKAREQHPRDRQVLLNLAVCLSRSAQPAPALDSLQELLQLDPGNIVAHDSLCAVLHQLGRNDEAAAAGTRALELKDRANGAAPGRWKLPDTSPESWAGAPGKQNVIAFSLWGAAPRYLRGAIDNALAAARVYPDWTLRYFVDDTVPANVLGALQELGVDIRVEAARQNIKQRLGWRFKVADDPKVGRFLVRDIDSVINLREKAAVDAWMASDRWFHSMRDWWTHTDLLLAGMWGGVAGILPPLWPMLQAYTPIEVETPNIDQWFLRDKVWRYVRQSCVVHDRCFTATDAQPWPVPPGHGHVGEDEFTAGRQAQEERLAAWLARLPALQLQLQPQQQGA
jgi:tetratricopeptide (TPR) repeat protein